jgi:Zn-dependent protease
LPIPPFDGSHIVEGVLPPRLAVSYARLRPLGMVLFFGLVALTWFAPQLGVLDKLFVPVGWLLERLLPASLTLS